MPLSRNDRLAADYFDMMKIQDRPYLSWIASKGELPYAEEYILTVRLRTYILSVRDGKYIVGTTDKCTVKISLWGSYPQVAPNISMISQPPVFHPDWYSKGSYCAREPWRPDLSLKDYIMQMLRSLRYDPIPADTAAPANYKAMDWYLKNRDNPALFPSDNTELNENTSEETAAAETAALAFGEIVDCWSIG